MAYSLFGGFCFGESCSFENYTLNFGVNGLLLCIKPGNQEIQTLPDYVGRWTNTQNNIAIIHNRLSILDLSLINSL